MALSEGEDPPMKPGYDGTLVVRQDVVAAGRREPRDRRIELQVGRAHVRGFHPGRGVDRNLRDDRWDELLECRRELHGQIRSKVAPIAARETHRIAERDVAQETRRVDHAGERRTRRNGKRQQRPRSPRRRLVWRRLNHLRLTSPQYATAV